jgi:hypothetical protein
METPAACATSSILTTFFLAIAGPQKIKVKVEAEVKKKSGLLNLNPARLRAPGGPAQNRLNLNLD